MQDAVTDSLILNLITNDARIVTQSSHKRVNQLYRPDKLIFLLHINAELIFYLWIFFFLSFRHTAVNFMRRRICVILGHQSSTVLVF